MTKSIPVWPPTPTGYLGPKIGKPGAEKKGEFKLIGGFGIPSAGMLRVSEGTKSFGVLG